jgi:hypothetical protein
VTAYTVLYKPEPVANAASGVPSGWQVLDKTYDATSNVSAVRAAAAESQKSGSYVAIPSRSFDVVRIEIETNPRVKVVK